MDFVAESFLQSVDRYLSEQCFRIVRWDSGKGCKRRLKVARQARNTVRKLLPKKRRGMYMMNFIEEE